MTTSSQLLKNLPAKCRTTIRIKDKDLKDSDVKLKGMIIDHRLNINLVFCACCHHFNGTALQNEKQNV